MTASTPATHAEARHGLTVLERGWLSSNNVLLHGLPGEGATLVDSGHCTQAEMTLALVRRALDSETLTQLVNTHLHSDHCGGNATLQRAFGMPVLIPPGQWQAARDWDEEALSYAPTRQRCERFRPDARLGAGDTLRVGGRGWEVFAAPGHDPESVILFDAAHGVLISADALWGNGFGVVFPELDGEQAFDDVAAVLDLIARLPVRWVVPGHGAPFSDVAEALARARARLAAFRADPARHDRHAAKVLLKFHLLEERSEPVAALHAWISAAPLALTLWQRLRRPRQTLVAWCDELVAELAAQQVVAVRGGVVHNA